jgi:hypothetical protein
VTVLGVQYYACRECDTVYADVGRPPHCDRCRAGSDALRELTPALQYDDYFTRGS